jgi:predicted Zn-dependent protease
MTRTTQTLVAIALVVAGTAAAVRSESTTPAERRIASARARIAKQPQRSQGHNDLAMALAARARETAEPDYYAQARAALADSRRVEPGNIEADKIEAWLLLGTHEFETALQKAQAVNRRVPDDLMTYGMLVDAYVELGRYAEAEQAAQWMLDLRPGAVPALTRAAYLRELFGDVEGALELMTTALGSLPTRETEERAWVLTQMAHLQIEAGRLDRAERLAAEALAAFPNYHYALAVSARVAAERGDRAQAAELFAARHRAAPHPENLYDLADALARAGRLDEAVTRFAEFETQARAEMDGADNANRELALYYVDHAGKPAEAVTILEREIARRRSLPVMDAYAWALHAAGRKEEARRVMSEVLKIGTADRGIRQHADVVLAAADERR